MPFTIYQGLHAALTYARIAMLMTLEPFMHHFAVADFAITLVGISLHLNAASYVQIHM